jgi:hypothetical protein
MSSQGRDLVIHSTIRNQQFQSHNVWVGSGFRTDCGSNIRTLGCRTRYEAVDSFIERPSDKLGRTQCRLATVHEGGTCILCTPLQAPWAGRALLLCLCPAMASLKMVIFGHLVRTDGYQETLSQDCSAPCIMIGALWWAVTRLGGAQWTHQWSQSLRQPNIVSLSQYQPIHRYLELRTQSHIYRMFRAQADWTSILPLELPAKELRHLPRKMPPRGTTQWESDKPAQWTPCSYWIY